MINDNTFYTYCEFVWDCPEKEFLKYVNKKCKIDKKSYGALGKTIYYKDDEKINCFIWIDNKNNYEILAHEILHLIRIWLQDYYGIDFNKETEEIYTLLHSFYFGKCFELLKKK